MLNFKQTLYTVDEGEGQVEVCVDLTGETERNLIVSIDTIASSATGNYFISIPLSFLWWEGECVATHVPIVDSKGCCMEFAWTATRGSESVYG